ncbi:MAG TPA: ribosome-associated translation inhibitor RaiA [Candidatus Paceibacterota bacterium]|nr:ribosome-associated translation inhibitor RaiA [Candidatus Paceibacterota bacterium]HOL53833.1 ribosome-associated translation inhibitor RaiA [Candidatus Paceibacterota bacterium]HON21881.1 ribosome-associated translation inhibitor RaiA [Candidatus Paceibacterota bacterium]HPP16904.1 ribosome-associated translation inhibitor RaiA [Candidatus Paceibacterota bacterium]HRU33460.1 ribosome-associated translation inhibitor RaiA [Candidatus Paceibacterota bacterium]
MNINYKIKDVVLTEEMQKEIENSIGTLIERYLLKLDEETNIQIDLELSRETHHHLKGNVFYVEVNMHLPGRVLRATANADDIKTGIDRVEEELKRQIKKYREKRESRFRKDWQKLKAFLRGEKE